MPRSLLTLEERRYQCAKVLLTPEERRYQRAKVLLTPEERRYQRAKVLLTPEERRYQCANVLHSWHLMPRCVQKKWRWPIRNNWNLYFVPTVGPNNT